MLKAAVFHLVASALLRGVDCQSVQCATVADGCDGGSRNQAGIESAIARFQDGQIYGGNDRIVMSSAESGGALAMITYLCNDGSVPPSLEGSAIRSSFQKILSCPNQCGGVASPSNANCGFGVLVANNAAGADCFSKAINVEPASSSPKTVSSVGGYTNPVCLFDAPDSRVLRGGSSDDHTGMTVEKCIAQAAADGWRYAGVEFGGECFWGDVQVNPERSNQADCNTPCAGNPSQVCGGGNRILLYENSNFQGVAQAKTSVDNYKNDPTNSDLARTAKNAIDKALENARKFLDQITNSAVKAAQEQLVQDLVAASSTATTAIAAASAAVAAVLADQIAKAVASEQAVENAKNQKPTQTISQVPSTITRAPTSTLTSTTSSSSSSTSSACPICISCADDQYPEIGSDDSDTVPGDDPAPQKRQADDEDNSNRGRTRLVKRANSKKEIEVCSTKYQSGPYQAGGGQMPSYGYAYTVNTQSVCVWKFNQLVWNPTQVGGPPATKGGSYESRGTNPFAARGGSALGQMMLNLPDNNSGGGTELVALDKELNILKAAVFNGATANFNSPNVAPGILAKVTRFAMLYSYLARPEVVAIFKATSQRMRATLRLLDQEINASTMTNPAFSFEEKYSDWEDNFLFGQGSVVEIEMMRIINAAILHLQTAPNLGSQQLRDNYVQQIRTLTATGAAADPSRWFDLDDLLRP
ncbi:WSC-domain-containing protein [Colletotrichum truncatum]|uniref:WSC-domain-containing protein n=1 Tax=Colletotrichum truncatum TaxID=5467 RepID=A0ACC3YZ43_COLTU